MLGRIPLVKPAMEQINGYSTLQGEKGDSQAVR